MSSCVCLVYGCLCEWVFVCLCMRVWLVAGGRDGGRRVVANKEGARPGSWCHEPIQGGWFTVTLRYCSRLSPLSSSALTFPLQHPSPYPPHCPQSTPAPAA